VPGGLSLEGGGGGGKGLGLGEVEGAGAAGPGPPDDMEVDHGGGHVAVPEQVLDRAYVDSAFE
jgi:hypothetical protein